jgi:hypothetical protein
MARLDRKRIEALDKLFDEFALKDQRTYYQSRIGRYRTAAGQINLIKASFAFVAGLSAALAGLIVQSSLLAEGRCGVTPIPDADQLYCEGLNTLVAVLAILAVVAPAIGGAFNTLADLYQWDRLVTVYDNALRNLAIADARSPDPEMDDLTFRASLNAYTQGTLTVMEDEAAQWGQLIRTPEQIESFIEAEREKLRQQDAERGPGGL